MPKGNNKQKNKLPRFVATLTMAGEEATIDVTGVIGWDTKATDFTDLVAEAKNAGCTKLKVRINSVGGYCHEGLAMGDCLKTCGMETTGVVIGTAQSMASYLLQCCDHRVTHKNATLMFHQPTAGVFGTVDEIATEGAYLCKMRDTMFETMGKRCGMTGKALSDEHMTKKMYNADDAKAKGFIDTIMGEEEEQGAPAPAPLPPDEEATACRLMPYESMAAMVAMLGSDDDTEDDTEDDDTDKGKDDGTNGGKKDEGKPTPPPAPKKDDEEEKPTPKKDDDHPTNAGNPPLTREMVAEMIAQARAEEIAKMGIPADNLPPAAIAGGEAVKNTELTIEELDAMPAMHRLRILSENPALAKKYMAS